MSAVRRRPARSVIVALVWTSCLLMPRPARGQEAERVREIEPVFELAPSGYIQLDWRSYPDWAVTPGSGRLEYDTFEVRRLRAGIDGRWRRVAFEVALDPLDLDGTLVKDAYAQMRVTSALRVRAGQFKVPGGRDYQTSARNLDFLERSALASSLAAGRDLGLMVTGDLTKAVEYRAGLFAGDGNGRVGRAGATGAGRVSWTGIDALEVGASLSVGRTSSSDDEPPTGLEGRTASGYRFFERVYVRGQRLRAGADARWEAGRWDITAEWLRTRDERIEQGQEFEDLPAALGTGWSVAVRRQFGRRQGRLRARLREWDIGVRLDALSFDDEGSTTGSDSVRPRAADIRQKSAQALTASISWQPLRWARFITDVAVERYGDERSAPEAGRAEPYWTAGTRLQIEWPW
jgi:phosphate-selective porin